MKICEKTACPICGIKTEGLDYIHHANFCCKKCHQQKNLIKYKKEKFYKDENAPVGITAHGHADWIKVVHDYNDINEFIEDDCEAINEEDDVSKDIKFTTDTYKYITKYFKKFDVSKQKRDKKHFNIDDLRNHADDLRNYIEKNPLLTDEQKLKQQAKRIDEIASIRTTGEKLQELKKELIDE